MIEEVWKDIEDYPMYQISNLGNVRSFSKKKKGSLLTTPVCSTGYCRITLMNNGEKESVFVHRLVAAAFIGDIPSGMQINHINGIKIDNRAENLEIVTPKENIRHSLDTHLSMVHGEHNGHAKLTDKQVLEIRARYVSSTVSQRKLAQEYGVTQCMINNILLRKAWTHI